MNDTNEVCDKCGQPMAIKEGKFGKFFACTGYPECKNTKQMHPMDQNDKPLEIPEEDKKCEKCASDMAIKNGKFGPFLACTGFPNCRNLKNIEQKTGVECPQCGQGDIVVKRSKLGKIFYSCNQYPQCKFALWSKPTGEKCPECGSLLTLAGNNIKCSNNSCQFDKKSTK